MAEEVGVEPTRRCRPIAFRVRPLHHLGTPPDIINLKTASDRTRIEQLKNPSLFELRGFGKPHKIKVLGYMTST